MNGENGNTGDQASREAGSSGIGRRSFLKGLALSAAAVAGASSLVACSPDKSSNGTSQTNAFTFADTVSWDGEYDVVVVGFGGAGAVAAKAAGDSGADVLLIDKAPEGHEGGNTRYCGQFFMSGNGDVEATKTYLRSLAGALPLDENVLAVFAEGVANIVDNYVDTYGVDRNAIASGSDPESNLYSLGSIVFSPEYPEFEGSETITINTLNDSHSDGYMWNMYRESIMNMGEHIDVWFESPARKLIQDPFSKTVVGVKIERDGKTVNIRAKNGVVLTCGGFENNREIIETYLGLGASAPAGTTYNTGDGIKMVMEIGADLWHMEVYEGTWISFVVPEGDRAMRTTAAFTSGATVHVGSDGSRYYREDGGIRHGHFPYGGVWLTPKWPDKTFIVVDAAQLELLKATNRIPEGYTNMYEGETIAQLAEKTGMQASILTETIANFNKFAETGVDVQFGRAPKSMKAFGDGPYYALEVLPCILNTQGGPRRNENAEILDVDGNPIPNLYSAGEFGGVTSNHYNGGGNMAECLIFGQIAGKNAAAKKADLPVFSVEAVESNITYTKGTLTDLSAQKDFETAANEYIGHGVGIGGDITVKVTIDDGALSNIEVLQQSETENIGGEALKALPQMVIEAQSTDIDVVSGATVTSKAFFEAVDEAIAQK